MRETVFKNRNSIRFVIDGGRGGSSARKKADEAEASAARPQEVVLEDVTSKSEAVQPQEVVLEDVTSKSEAVVIASSRTTPVPVHRLNLQQSRTNQVRSLQIRAVGSGGQGVD